MKTNQTRVDWLTERPAPESLAILRALSSKCGELGGDLAVRLNSLAQTDPSALMSFEINYEGPDSPSNVSDAVYSRQILAFFQKNQFLEYKPGWSTKKAAAVRFVQSEQMCLETNRRIKLCATRPDLVDRDVSNVLHIAQRKIAAVLGDLPDLDGFSFAFGPGANTNVKSASANPRVKLGVPLECSSNLSPTVGGLLSEVPHWTSIHDVSSDDSKYIVNVSVVPGKVMFVPKNAKTDRSIVVEPLLNGFFQKGVGSYMRDRLLRFNIDLTNQGRNQRLARFGSIYGSIATVDLSMASDCIASQLVWDLLPYEWADFLSALRTSEVVLPDSVDSELLAEYGPDLSLPYEGVYRLEKFSSMGNGYTFELESLIFYGICSSVVSYLNLDSDLVGVYGDDLIVPTPAHDLLVRVLTHCGFSINKEKSFASGPFRESCGGDYLSGFDIRPFYQKTLISGRTLFTMHNYFIRNTEYELAKIVESFIPQPLRLYGPDEFGDGHLIGTYQIRRNRTCVRMGWEGGYFDTYALKPRCDHKVSPGDSVLPVYSVYVRSGKDSPTDPFVTRGSRGYTKISIYTLRKGIFLR